MFYEEQVRDGVLCYRSTPTGDWVPMSAERLTAMLLELRQRQVAVPQPFPVMPVPQPTWVPGPWWQPPYTITCGDYPEHVGAHARQVLADAHALDEGVVAADLRDQFARRRAEFEAVDVDDQARRALGDEVLDRKLGVGLDRDARVFVRRPDAPNRRSRHDDD